ncbi:MAG: IS4 family transposase [Caldilineaceae bacterium]|nr:IS4 family transposase [Caldilineaceae bacterium]
MTNNLQLYHKTVNQLCQWLPSERITRLRNMALLLVGLQVGRGIHMSQIVNQWPGVVGKLPSLVNRLGRFLRNPRVEVRRWYEPLAKHLINQFKGQALRLIIDCTKVGFNFRMLSISIAYKKRALPLVWSIHRGRKGHVGYNAQLELLEYLVELIGDEAEVWLLGDAGFESVHLFNWLTQHNWHFVLRHPGKNKVRWPGQPWVKLSAIPVQPGETRNIGWVELTAKHAAGPYWLTIHWATGEEEPWFLLSDCTDDRTLLRLYAIRMWTEELYGDLKSHGFDLEATHLDDADRIARLVLAVCINFVWFIALGVWLVKRGWRHLLDHKSRRDKSYFRLGLDWLDRCFRLNHPIPLRFTLYF